MWMIPVNKNLHQGKKPLELIEGQSIFKGARANEDLALFGLRRKSMAPQEIRNVVEFSI